MVVAAMLVAITVVDTAILLALVLFEGEGLPQIFVRATAPPPESSSHRNVAHKVLHYRRLRAAMLES
jgi:hypothetical protein